MPYTPRRRVPVAPAPRPPASPQPQPKLIPGPQGPQGPEGPQGQPGAPGQAPELTIDDEGNLFDGDTFLGNVRGPEGQPGQSPQVDYDRLLTELLKRLPPIKVENYDINGRLIDSMEYPYPGPIKLRHGVPQRN